MITGDLIDAQRTDVGIALCFAQESVKIAPTYYVTGNHEAASPQYDTLKAGLEAAVALETALYHSVSITARRSFWWNLMPDNTQKLTAAMVHTAICGGLPFPQAGLIREITWKGNMRVGLIGRKAKNFRGVFTFFQYAFCLSFPKSGRFVTSARKIEIFCRYKKIDTYL